MTLKSLLPDQLKDPESLRRLYLSTAIISVAVIVLLSGLSFHRVFSDFVVVNAQDDSVELCNLLVDQQKPFLFQDIPGQGVRLAIDKDFIPSLDENLRLSLHPFSILKVKIFDGNRRIIYSTDARIIGRVDAANRRLDKALAGTVATNLKTKKEARDLSDEQLLDVDVVETYVPIRSAAGKVLGSFEVYMNVTKYRGLIRYGVLVMTIVLASVLAAVFGFSYILIRRGTNQLRDVQSKLEMLAITDMLTGISNRGYAIVRGEEEFSRAVRNKENEPLAAALGCIMLDIDHFKKVNDTKGHLAGDRVLREVALRLRQSVRPYDIIGRYGGEEFVVLMPDTTLEQGMVAAERIRTAIRSEPFCIDGGTINVSVSLGVACSHEEDRELSDLLKRADEGLYKAKEGGRDRVEWIAGSFAAIGAA